MRAVGDERAASGSKKRRGGAPAAGAIRVSLRLLSSLIGR
jgi:hypothetical protein